MTKNLLVNETSPYLLQHKDNPVHWYPWGHEAFDAAKSLDKPILLSIGYAACHWCHVMAHESFEDQQTANLMNAEFINIKIDREEFPDVDKLYMDAVHLFGERGGWPLTMFLEPDGTPFWGGTYFPNKPQYGRPSFTQILFALSRTWKTQRDKITKNKQTIVDALNQQHEQTALSTKINPGLLTETANQILTATDKIRGGLSGAPKFPQTTMYEFLWRMYLKTGNQEYRTAVVNTLTQLCQGGIYDHLDGGFCRYSVDERWLVPHFEKMLYDNALIVDLLILVNKSENNILFRKRIEQSVSWLLNQMTTAEGAFASSYDADSEGEEGKYYVWSYPEICQVIPEPNQKLLCKIYDISKAGNWEGKNIPNRLNYPKTIDSALEQTLQECLNILRDHRTKRVKPGWDNKILVDWNGLTITMLCNAALYLEKPELLKSAKQAYTTIFRLMFKDRVLQHAFRKKKTTNIATADDYANLIKAALMLFEATFDNKFLEDAKLLAKSITELHWHPDSGGYSLASSKAQNLLTRSHFAHDDATPNANGTMLSNLVKLYNLTGKEKYYEKADALIRAFSRNIISAPMAHAGMLKGFLEFLEPLQIVIITPDRDTNLKEILKTLYNSPIPATISAISQNEKLPETHPAHGKAVIDNKPTIYICLGTTCTSPLTNLSDLQVVLANLYQH